MQAKGYLIVIEGIDGSGKTLLAQNLQKTFLEQSKSVVLTLEPGGTTLGKKLRQILHEEKENVCDLAEYLLFAADRAQHTEQIITPALNAGKIIISDRMGDSSVAYQGYGRGLDVEMIKSVNNWATKQIKPDIVFYLEIDIQTAIERVFKRKETLTTFEKEKVDFWQKVIKGYEQIFKDRKNVIKLNATLSPEQVLQQALKYVKIPI
jgi:dTMP kinase